jgi:hypothetical protein
MLAAAVAKRALQIMQFRFFPPDASYLHEQVRKRMARGREADKLAERLRRVSKK